MRYHINDDFEVMPCTAEEGNCPFGDNPHFNDKKSADQGLEKLLTERLGTTSKVYQSRNAENFVKLAKIQGLFSQSPRVFDNSVDGRDPVEIRIDEFIQE